MAEIDDTTPKDGSGPEPEPRVPDLAVGAGPFGPYLFKPGRVLLIADHDTPADELDALGARGRRLVAEITNGEVRVARRRGFVMLELDRATDVPEVVTALNRADFNASVDVSYLIDGLTAAPMTFNGAYMANPMTFNGAYYAAPMTFNGQIVADPMTFNQRSTARPYAPPAAPFDLKLPAGTGQPVVAVIDTGFTKVPPGASVVGQWKLPSGDLFELPDPLADDILDPAAGHNGFIQGIVRRAAPRAVASLRGIGVVDNLGVAQESDLAEALTTLFDEWSAAGVLEQAIVNLSLSGYYADDTPPPLVADRIRLLTCAGVVVVGSAGNDGDCRPAFPAAMAEVIGVGSVGACGPSWFSNHGPWVNASAPGEDVISEFFTWDGGFDQPAGTDLPDPDNFTGWAMWSGTSFAAPRVAGAIARNIQLFKCTAIEAADMVVRRPGLFRLPDYGVIVNQGF